jgi:hypothetical protein
MPALSRNRVMDAAERPDRDRREIGRGMLKVYPDDSCSSVLLSIFAAGAPDYFQVAKEPASADVVVFQRDDWSYIRRSVLFRTHPSKCICISECDKPSFFIPAVCASNEYRWFTKGRTETSNYLISQRHNWNECVTRLSIEQASKKYLYSYIGKCSSLVRKRLIRHYVTRRGAELPDDVLIEPSDSQVSDHVFYSADCKRRYAEIMAASKFALCPQGWGTSSVRLFEACEMGVAPVILANRWVPISRIDWTFAIFIDERRVRDLDAIVRSHASEWVQRGRRARQIFLENFANEVAPRFLYQRISRLMGRVTQKRESAIRRLYPAIYIRTWTAERIRKAMVSYRP